MANEELRFDIIGNDRATGAFSRVGGSVKDMGDRMNVATKQAVLLDEAMNRQRTAARVSVDATLALAKADDILAEAEHTLRDGALEAELALKRETEAKKKSGDAALEAAAKNKRFQDSLNKVASGAQSKGGPGWLGPALLAAPVATTVAGVGAGAAIGLGGAFVTAGIAAAAYGTVAKSVLSQAATASQAASKAQTTYNAAISAGVPKVAAQATLQKANAQAQLTYNAALAGGANPAKALAAYHLALAKNQESYNAATSKGTYNAKAYAAEQRAITKAYEGMSPAQVQLAKQLGGISDQWSKFRQSVTPLIASSLQPWLKGVGTGLQSLKSLITPMGPVVHDLGSSFATLTDSSVFRTFTAWVGTEGAKVAGSAGGAVLDLITAMTFLLPKFSPLITGAANGISKWGDAFVKWSASQKAANEIQSFLTWFHDNGPLVTTLLKNVGGALKALAPGLGPASATELKLVSGFFAFIAKLPPGVAKPLEETAAVLLTLNKLGVVKVGLNVSGKLAGKFATTALGKSLLGEAGVAGLVLPVTLSVAAIAGLSQIKDKKGGGSLLAPKAADLGYNGSWAHDISHWWDVLNADIGGIQARMRHATFAWADSVRAGVITDLDSMRHQASSIWDQVWSNTVGRANRGSADTLKILSGWQHNVSHWFDTARHDASSIWDSAWNNTVGRANRGSADTIRLLSGWEHNVAHWFDTARHDAASIWASTWSNTVGQAQRGVNDVVRWVSTVPGRVTGVFRGARSWLYNQGRDILYGLWDGLEFVWHKVTGWISSLAGWIKAHKGPVSFDRTLLEPAGRALMTGLRVGLEGGFVGIKDIVSGMAGSIGNQFSGLVSLGGKVGSFISGLFGGGGNYKPGAGVSQWKSVVDQALRLNGLSTSLDSQVLYQMQTESGGNPNIQNNTDSNARAGTPSRGLMQVIGPTFSAYHVAGTSSNILNPLANVAAAINYARHVYGPSLMNRFGGIGSGHGYATGTLSAAPGWAWVGERGPELMHFRGGEQVVPHHAAAAGSTYVINVHPTPLARPADIGREVVGAIRAHEQRSGKGWRS